jgi:hypothetical protein
LSKGDVRKLQAALHDFTFKEVVYVSRDALTSLTQAVKADLERSGPVDSGRMRASIEVVRKEVSDGKIWYAVRIKTPYAASVVFGNKTREGSHFVQKSVDTSGRLALNRAANQMKSKLSHKS